MSVPRLAPVAAAIALFGLAHCLPQNPTAPASPVAEHAGHRSEAKVGEMHGSGGGTGEARSQHS
jgi:hypothetical protein